ncbi:MAG: flavin-binding protein [Sphingomonadales bacterium]|nr:flavin-binding protein [Sphingomonadales bacterium]
MILRESDWRAQRLRFHTDIRSTKIAQLETRKQMSVLIYDEAAKLQLRLSGTAWVEASAEADTAWQMSTPFARRCYMADVAPGTVVDTPTSGLPSWIEGRKPDEAQLIHARDNFAVLLFFI